MSELDTRAARGIRALMGRQAIVQVLTLGAGIVLARTLTPTQFGLYFIATFFVSTFAFFADFGFGPSLIQQRGELRTRDLRVAFTLQVIASSVVVVALVAAAHWLVLLYPKAPHGTAWLIRVLALQIYLTSFRTLSVLQLERRLSYGRVAVVESVETLVYQSVAVAGALSGLGVWSLAVAVVARATLGTVIAFVLAPWRVGLALDRATARSLLGFGVPFQLSSFLQQAGGWLTPLLVGPLAGAGAVGLLGWASSNARKPLALVENVMRVAFPHFSRLQEDPDEVERVLGRYIRFLMLASSLWLVGILVAAKGVVPAVYGSKWNAAVPSLMIFAGALWFDTLVWLLAIALSGLGSIGLVARINGVRTAVFIGVGVTLVLVVGYIGVPIAALVSVAVMVPPLVRGFGHGAARRLLVPLLRTLPPPAVALAGGLAARMLPLAEPARSLAAGAVAVFIFTGLVLVLKLAPAPRRRFRMRAPEPQGQEAAA